MRPPQRRLLAAPVYQFAVVDVTNTGRRRQYAQLATARALRRVVGDCFFIFEPMEFIGPVSLTPQSSLRLDPLDP